jgi:hypothetical protein
VKFRPGQTGHGRARTTASLQLLACLLAHAMDGEHERDACIIIKAGTAVEPNNITTSTTIRFLTTQKAVFNMLCTIHYTSACVSTPPSKVNHPPSKLQRSSPSTGSQPLTACHSPKLRHITTQCTSPPSLLVTWLNSSDADCPVTHVHRLTVLYSRPPVSGPGLYPGLQRPDAISCSTAAQPPPRDIEPASAARDAAAAALGRSGPGPEGRAGRPACAPPTLPSSICW